jgi:hypothetical protein
MSLTLRHNRLIALVAVPRSILRLRAHLARAPLRRSQSADKRPAAPAYQAWRSV